MKEEDNMPVSRWSRAGKFVGTGARLSGNYFKYYAQRLWGEGDAAALQEANASDIYSSLSKLKGSALKVAQMMSLDQGLLPEAYTRHFSQAQYSVPPLSYPLVVQTFRKSLGQSPTTLFDNFSSQAVAAASIGQVHRAEKDGIKLAVKVQYPGVAQSISSDLRMIRPIVSSMFNISSRELDHYLTEVQERLLEETDYQLELQRSREITAACAHMDQLVFPRYFPEYSSDRILTMEWIDGLHLGPFVETDPTQDERDRIGQALWDFYDFQIHSLRQVHADPHPGNFLIQTDGKLGVIDFGCVKSFDENFHATYFKLMQPEVYKDPAKFHRVLRELDFLLSSDREDEVEHFTKVYREVHGLLCQPFFQEEFDFADKEYFARIYALSEVYSQDRMLRKAKAARGPRDSIYLNRTYFGLYSLLHQLGARVNTLSHRTDLLAEAG